MRTRPLVLGALLCALVAGCGGDPSSSPTSPPPSESVTPSPSAPATPTAPALPAAASANTKAGAVAFVRHYVALINRAQFTGDVAPLRDNSSSDCVACRRVVGDMQKFYAAGGSVKGGRWSIVSIHATKSDLKNPGWATLVQINAPAQVVRRPGEPEQELAGGPTTQSILVERSGSAWEVRKWMRVD